MVDLRSLVQLERVLDGQLVQSELVGQAVEVVAVGVHDVDPHERVVERELVGHLRQREVLGRDHAVGVGAGAHVAHDEK